MCSDENSDYQKMKFYLSKADTAGSDKERQKVITQMARDLYGDPVNRPGMAKVGTHAEVPTIYIPQGDAAEQVGKQVPNDIDQVGELLEKQIKTNVQVCHACLGCGGPAYLRGLLVAALLRSAPDVPGGIRR